MNPAADVRSADSSERFPEDTAVGQGERPGEVCADDAAKYANARRLTKSPDDIQPPVGLVDAAQRTALGRAAEDALAGVLAEGVALAVLHVGAPAGFEAMLPLLERAAALVPGACAAGDGDA